LSNDKWLSCSGGCNDLGTGQGCADCDANSPASIEIRCNQGGNVRGDVRLEDGKFPEVFLNGIWSPICGHWFWDTDFGANLFCQRLTSDPASTGQVFRRWDKRLEKDAIRIGKCLSNDKWLSCSGGCNDLGTGQGWCADCDANSLASIEIKCN